MPLVHSGIPGTPDPIQRIFIAGAELELISWILVTV